MESPSILFLDLEMFLFSLTLRLDRITLWLSLKISRSLFGDSTSLDNLELETGMKGGILRSFLFLQDWKQVQSQFIVESITLGFSKEIGVQKSIHSLFSLKISIILNSKIYFFILKTWIQKEKNFLKKEKNLSLEKREYFSYLKSHTFLLSFFHFSTNPDY